MLFDTTGTLPPAVPTPPPPAVLPREGHHTDGLPTAEPEDFVGLFTDHYRRLVAALRIAGADSGAAGAAGAEDIAQEAFARTLGHWRRVRRGSNPAGYVYRVAFRLLRRRGRLPGTPLDEAEPQAGGAGPEDDAVARATARALLVAMPPRRRACAVLCWYLGFTAEEAGATLGVDSATVRKQLERARRAAQIHSSTSSTTS